MKPYTRREFAQLAAVSLTSGMGQAQIPGERPAATQGATILNPRNRVPVSLLIDDSTCLVNLAHFCIPQFAEVYPDRYRQNWKALPREIPDSFVRKFGEWCHDHKVKGKYSIVPNPACVGWMDRDIPGWSKRELEDSIKLVRTLMVPDWDIHPEMVTHTWVIDTKTGRPYPERSERYMENWGWSVGKSADQLADYLSYALKILKNAELPCEGITTPGGFGGRALPELSQATLQSVRDVFRAEIPHYFRHAFMDERSVAPKVEYVSGLDSADPKCVVSIIACTGDWYGGWDGLEKPQVDRFITADLRGGRMPQVINKGEPAIMLCHWPGIYCNGEEHGFRAFQEVVRRLHSAYDNLLWMKISEIARYWAAKELTRVERGVNSVSLHAPFACPDFTLQIPMTGDIRQAPRLSNGSESVPLTEVRDKRHLNSGKWVREGGNLICCFELHKGEVVLAW